ncbi:MAG: hydrogenase maturation nickel metallochaperone HypA [Firmicutes bacterium]|nr:hydrogenase maturation nickel metallochaperone HypA [Bacillota bacterium]
MHEYQITEQIIRTASKHCKDNNAEKVTKIKLVLGDRSGLVSESISMYFDVIGEGTPCEGAEIEIERVRTKMKCPKCGELFYRELLSFACPKCGTDGEPTEIGKEFYIDYIEVE